MKSHLLRGWLAVLRGAAVYFVSPGVLICLWVAPVAAQQGEGGEVWQFYDRETLEPGKDPRVVLPLSFEVGEGCYLYVDYTPAREITLSWDPRGLLLLNGVGILGSEPPSAGVEPFGVPEERCSELFADVPYISDLVQRGASWQEAGRQWYAERMRIELVAEDAFYGAVGDGVPAAEAARQAAARALEADSAGIYAPPGEVYAVGDDLQFTPIGHGSWMVSHREPYNRRGMQERAGRYVSEAEAQATATTLFELLSGVRSTPAFVRVVPGIVASTGKQAVEGMVRQLDEGRRDLSKYPEGRLSRHEVRGFLNAEGLAVGW